LLAHELAKDQKLNFGDDITAALRTAKKKVNLWLLSSFHFFLSLFSVVDLLVNN